MANLELVVVTAEGESFSGEVDAVVAPGELGEFTVLPSHAKLISSLNSGILRFDQGGDSVSLALTGGFLEVANNKVTVLADAAERDEDIDLERAEAALERAQERIASAPADLDLERALASMRRARVRINLGRRRRNRDRVAPGS
ncbi:MAG: F0F1 ATP synthase subunit epsilon [Chloroflexota bacterium]|jgi:F-type H+-transporting ATPase subunit epsilon